MLKYLIGILMLSQISTTLYWPNLWFNQIKYALAGKINSSHLNDNIVCIIINTEYWASLFAYEDSKNLFK